MNVLDENFPDDQRPWLRSKRIRFRIRLAVTLAEKRWTMRTSSRFCTIWTDQRFSRWMRTSISVVYAMQDIALFSWILTKKTLPLTFGACYGIEP